MIRRWLRNEKPPITLTSGEEIGLPRQTTWIDPLSESSIVHEGYTVEELTNNGYVGVYKVYKEKDNNNESN